MIVDHLTPPLTRAEFYGPLAELERLVDEYYEAAGVDPRRTAYLRGEILALSRRLGLDRDVGIAPADDRGRSRSPSSTTTSASSRNCRSGMACTSSATAPAGRAS